MSDWVGKGDREERKGERIEEKRDARGGNKMSSSSLKETILIIIYF